MAYDVNSESLRSSKSKQKYILTDSLPIAPTLHKKLETFIPEKYYKLETLLIHGCLQGQVGHKGDKHTKPVIAFPMGTHSWHCINYTQYPEEPRFLTASSDQKRNPELHLLGTKPFNVSAKLIFLTEGIWDMLTLYEHSYHTLGLPGVNNLQEEWCEIFKEKEVYILFDNDKTGKEYALKHARTLTSYASAVHIINLPEFVEYKGKKHSIKDITDLYHTLPATEADSFLQKLVDVSEEVIVDIQQRIKEIVLSKGNNVPKSLAISDLILRDIEENGGKIIPYNNNQEFALVLGGNKILTDEKIDIYLSQKYGYVPSDVMWRYTRDRLYNLALSHPEASIKIYSHIEDHTCYIGTQENGLVSVSPLSISLCPQGENGIYIKSNNNLPLEEILNYKPKKDKVDINSLLDLFIYDGSTDVQKFLLKIWFFHSFFNPVMRVILCVTGDPGSGKTLLLKLLKGMLFGFNKGISNPNSMPEEDYVFTTMMKEYRYLFIDEINESDHKLKTKFRMLATGEEAVFRPKYARQSIRFRPKMWLAVSAHSPKFRESDIAQRLCIIRLSHPSKKVKLINEGVFLDELQKKRTEIWHHLLHDLQAIMANVQKNNAEHIPLKNYCRQVEMANFAWQAFPKERDLCLKTFEGINKMQENFAAEFDPIIDLVDLWMEQHSSHYIKDGSIVVGAKALYNDMHALSKEKGLKSFPASVQGFGKWINGRNGILADLYGYERQRNLAENSYQYIFKKPALDGKEIF